MAETLRKLSRALKGEKLTPAETSVEILRLINEGKVTKEALNKVVTTLLSGMRDLSKAVSDSIGQNKKFVDDKTRLLQEDIYDLEDSLKRLVDTIESSNESKLDKILKEIYQEFEYVKNSIPEITDLSDIETRLFKLENPPEETGEEIVEKINNSEGVIKRERVEGLDEELERISKTKSKTVVQGTSGRDFIYAQDIGDQFDGSTKTFNISGVYLIIAVMLDSYPYGALVEGTHYNYTSTTITFTDEIYQATQLASGQRCKIIAVKI